MEQSTDLSSFQFPVQQIQGGEISPQMLNGKKGALILFYADWCFHCRNLKPVFKQFAEKNKNGNVVIGIMDMVKYGEQANKNLAPLHIEGFPTILAFDSKGRYFSTFSGGRDEDSLNKYLQTIGDYSYIKNNVEKIRGGQDDLFRL